MGALDDVRLRLGRAIANTDRLNVDISDWRSSEPRPHRVTFKQETGNQFALVARIDKEPELNWGFLFGDIITDLRFALDYLAYQLVIAHTGQDPPPYASSIEFPIYIDPDRYRETDKRGKPTPRSGFARVANMSVAAQVYIESIQPYHSGGATDGLWALHELCNINKHRLIHPALAILDETPIHLSQWGSGGGVRSVTAYKVDRLKDGDIIARLRLGGGKKGRPSHVDVQASLAVEIVVDPGPPLPRIFLPRDVRGLVEMVFWHCMVLTWQFAKP